MNHRPVFSQVDAPIQKMKELYPIGRWLEVLVGAEKYLTWVPHYLPKGSFQWVLDNGLRIYNHSFLKSVELWSLLFATWRVNTKGFLTAWRMLTRSEPTSLR